MNELMKAFGSKESVTVFENPMFGKVRVIEEDGKTLFCGSDVAKALGYSNPNKAINDHCRAITKRSTPVSGKIQDINFIPEGDVYRLIAHSKLPTAERFESWVFDEVIPSIRKHGAYLTPETLSKAIADPQWSIALLTALKEEREKVSSLQEENAAQKQMLAEAAPKVRYCDVVLRSKGAVSISKIAKDYGMSAQEMNQKLADLSIHYRQGNCWLLYQRYARSGYTQSHTTVAPDGKRGNHKTMRATLSTNWTQKGRLFLYEVLKSKLNLVPLIERDEVAA